MKIRNVLTFVFLLLIGLLQACSEDNDKMTETAVGGLMDFSFLTVDGDGSGRADGFQFPDC